MHMDIYHSVPGHHNEDLKELLALYGTLYVGLHSMVDNTDLTCDLVLGSFMQCHVGTA